MSWFGKKKTPVTLPFPPERLSMLATMIIPIAIERGLRLRQFEGDWADIVWDSEFLNSYVCGYPDYLDEYKPEIGAIARYTLISALWGDRDGSAQKRMDFFKARLEQNDVATHQAAQIAAYDGSQYFEALVEGRDADESITDGLILAIRTIKDFPSMYPD